MTSVSPSPALEFTRSHQWLLEGKHNPIASLTPIAPDTVQVIVRDGWAEPGEEGMDQWTADAAAGMLEPVVDGVKLLVTTPDGTPATPTWFTGDENYFATSLPGVTSQVAEVGWDKNGDGEIGDDETSYLFEMEDQAAADRLNPLIRESYGEYDVDFVARD